MTTFSSQHDLIHYIQAQPNPAMAILDRMCVKAFGADSVRSSAFQDLKLCTPALIEGMYRGDAIEFLKADLNEPYVRLRDMMTTLRDSLQVMPQAGESITGYLDRLIQASLQEMKRTTQSKDY